MTITEPRSSDWRTVAACAGTGPDLFFDTDPAAIAAAQRVCATCPARSDCAAHAFTTGEPFGVWGGLTEHDRQAEPERRNPGRVPELTDANLIALFGAANPTVRAAEVIRRHADVHVRTVYKLVARAVELGVAERRNGGLYPTRRR